MSYLMIKALHIIFVVTWFAGLFYIVRLFIYHVEAGEKQEPEKTILQNQFLIMQRRLWYGITWPSAVLAIIFGLILATNFFPLTNHPWLITKLIFVLLLFIYHLYCGKILKSLRDNSNKFSSTQLRVYNEIATLFLFAIVFLVVLKNLMNAGMGLLSFVALSLILFSVIKLLKNRWKN